MTPSERARQIAEKIFRELQVPQALGTKWNNIAAVFTYEEIDKVAALIDREVGAEPDAVVILQEKRAAERAKDFLVSDMGQLVCALWDVTEHGTFVTHQVAMMRVLAKHGHKGCIERLKKQDELVGGESP